MSTTITADIANAKRSLFRKALAFEFPKTDWDSILKEQTPSVGLIEQLRSFEPLDLGRNDHDPDLEHRIHVLQTRLRLALRRESGLPLLGDRTCGCCGERPIDPVIGDCLWCSEPYRLSHWRSEDKITVIWDVSTSSWGIRMSGYHGNDKISLMLCRLFRDQGHALRVARTPHVFCHLWDQSFEAVGSFSPGDILHLPTLIAEDLPLSPEDFIAWMENRILSTEPEPTENPYFDTIRRAVGGLLESRRE